MNYSLKDQHEQTMRDNLMGRPRPKSGISMGGVGWGGSDEDFEALLNTLVVPTDTDQSADTPVVSPPIEKPVAPIIGFEKPVAIESTAPAVYRFPFGDQRLTEAKARFSDRSSADLLGRLGMLANPRKPYKEVRYEMLAISLLLNQRQSCPPRFREYRSPGFTKPGQEWDKIKSLIHNDRQVIDLHWLSISRPDIRVKKWEGLFAPDGLDFELASEFAVSGGKNDAKVKALGLSGVEELLLASIQRRAVKDRWRDIQRRADEATGTFRTWYEDAGKRATATVDQLTIEYKILATVGERYKQAVKLVDSVMGRKVSERYLRNRFGLFKELRLLRSRD